MSPTEYDPIETARKATLEIEQWEHGLALELCEVAGWKPADFDSDGANRCINRSDGALWFTCRECIGFLPQETWLPLAMGVRWTRKALVKIEKQLDLGDTVKPEERSQKIREILNVALEE